MPVNPYQKYQQQSVMTMTQGEMLTKLFNEIIKQLSGAKLYIAQKDYFQANTALQKAQRVLNYLKLTLDMQYKISESLNALYDYFIEQAVKANLKKDPAPIEEILPMVADLRDSFVQADKNVRSQ